MKKEIQTVIDNAEHFDGNIQMAAAAEVFGLGVVKLKKGIPGNATKKQRAEVATIGKDVIAAIAADEKGKDK